MSAEDGPHVPALRRFLAIADERMPGAAHARAGTAAFVDEIGGDDAVLRAAADAARTRSLAECIALLHSHARDGEDLPRSLTRVVEAAGAGLAAGPPPLAAQWRALSVIETSFTLGHACAVLDLADRDAAEDAVADLVTAGVLLRVEEDDHLRFRMRIAHRIAARRGADRATVAAARAGLMRWWSDAADAFGREWYGPDEAERFDGLERELPMLVALVESDTAHEDDLVGIVARLWPLWIVRGRVDEARALLAGLTGDGPTDPRQLFEARWSQVRLALHANDTEAADALLADARPVDDVQAVRMLQLRGIRAVHSTTPERARTLLEAALTAHRDAGSAVDIHLDLSYLAASALRGGDRDAAVAYATRTRAHAAEHGERWLGVYAIWIEALAAWYSGSTARAFARAREGAALAATFGDRHAATLCLEVLAWCEAADGDPTIATRLLGVARTLEQVVGIPMLLWDTDTRHEAAVTAIIGAIGEDAYTAALERSRMDGLRDALTWLDDLPERADTVPVPRTPLTARQLEVAHLIAEGATNKQIAAQLMVTVRAVEAHIERIFARLGFVSRAQVAAWAVRRPADR